MSASLFWFRRDLRLTDNPGLNAAAGSGGPVYAVYCLDELDKLNARQRAFAIGSLRALRTVLEKRDATLTLVRGSPSEALVRAAQRLEATAVYCSRSYSRSERAVESEAATRTAPLRYRASHVKGRRRP